MCFPHTTRKGERAGVRGESVHIIWMWVYICKLLCVHVYVQSTFREGDLRVIRPFVYVREKDLRTFADSCRLPVIAENCPACFEAPKVIYIASSSITVIIMPS